MADIHPSRKRKFVEAASGGHGAKKSKKRRSANTGQTGNAKTPKQPDAQADSISALKRRIRDLTRVLSHVDNDPTKKMPQTVRIERERELETCEHELAEKLAQQKESDFKNKIIGRYHHVRFFERRKAERTAKRLRKQLADAEDDGEKARLLQMIHNADVDVNYTIYYPLLRPYVSIFPNPPKVDDNASPAKKETAVIEHADGPKGNLEIWKAVEKAMEDRTLEALRNSREGVTIPGADDPMWQYPRGRKEKKHHLREEREKEKRAQGKSSVPDAMEVDEDSDGGFFET
ncbi:hypothetical protein CC80DRAFT_442320 [Byssothecium circinans]|uniref:rRNA-processing protein EFG1 n=1 Tax=Byssothecium circinans TaxID=147558 RepID=A0A6A5U150_9PLEO|nr:hypothetical protein CC80DRAFT_442320 [Byssothecium circinans]